MTALPQVKLDGGDLDQARDHMRAALAALSAIGTLISKNAKVDLPQNAKIRFFPNATGGKTIYRGADFCYVYDNDEGVFRVCDSRDTSDPPWGR